MHEDLRLLECVGDQRSHRLLQHLRFARTQLQCQVSLQQPVGKEAHLESQQLLVVRRQLRSGLRAASLDLDQRCQSSGRYIVVPRSVSSRTPSRSERCRIRGACTPISCSMAATRR